MKDMVHNQNQVEKQTAADVWSRCMQIVKEEVNNETYASLFEPIVPLVLRDNTLTIQVPSHGVYEYIEENYVDLLRRVIRKELGPSGKLTYSIIAVRKPEVTETATPGYRPYTKNPSSKIPVNNAGGATVYSPYMYPGMPQQINIQSQLQENYSFENFVEGECNRLARSAGFAVAEKPGLTAFNPLFIYSKSGLGKTHLANAIGLEIKKLHPEKVVLYVHSEQFCQQFQDACKNNDLNNFIHFYQMLDVLLFDDVQFLAKREKMQDAFFHIFSHMQTQKKQLVIMSDCAPSEIKGFADRLVNRFKWGLSADLQMPDLPTRLAILRKMVSYQGMKIPEDVIEYLAYTITTSVRELEGALITLHAQSTLNRKEISVELARQQIDKYVKCNNREVSIEYIIKKVCDYYGILVSDVSSKTRKREIVQARQLAMFFAKKLTKHSLATIGMMCGKKDHATVLHACKTIENLLATNRDIKREYEEIEKIIKEQ